MADLIAQGEAEMKKVIEHLKTEYSHLQIGRASASLVENVMVEAYGSNQPLKAVAHVSVPDAKTIQIQPWDKGTLQAIERGILMANLGLTPNNDGIVVRINIPQLTEERRRDLTKIVSKLAEDARISVRHARQTVMDSIKGQEKTKEISEDIAKGLEKKLQERVDAMNQEIEVLSKTKESDVMKV
jgi:ribosome recycling factor